MLLGNAEGLIHVRPGDRVGARRSCVPALPSFAADRLPLPLVECGGVEDVVTGSVMVNGCS